MHKNPFYTSIAPYYDLIFPADPEAAAFILRHRHQSPDRPESYIDAGCGSGSLALDLAASGCRVTGIDADPELIRTAEIKAVGAKVPVSPVFRVMDMQKLSDHFKPSSAVCISCLGNTLVHLSDRKAVADFLHQVSTVLVPEGHLFLQIINYDRILDRFISGLPTIENSKIRFERNYQRTVEGSFIIFKTSLLLKDTGRTITNTIPLIPLRKNHLINLLYTAGFTVVETFGDFDDRPFTDDSIALIIKAGLLS